MGLARLWRRRDWDDAPDRNLGASLRAAHRRALEHSRVLRPP
jgi:hypothetical protein